MTRLEPLASVIIPVYNTGAFIKQTIESVLAKTWPNKEIIVVNDGSTDNTSSVLESFGNLIQVIDQENRGLGAARNSGIKAARGDFLAFIDADDLWRPEFLQTQITELLHNPQADIGYCWWSYIDENGNQLPQQDRYFGSGDLTRDLLISNRFPPMAAVIRRICIETIQGFDENRLISEDWDFWLRSAQSGLQFICKPQEMVQYRFHGTNMTLNTNNAHLRYIRVLDKFFDQNNLPEYALKLKSRAYGQVFLTTVVNNLRNEDLEKAHAFFIEGVKNYPALIFEINTYYRIICAKQPPGYLDTQFYVDLERSEQQISHLIEAVFSNPISGDRMVGSKKRAYATAQYTLALHSYKAGLYDRSRNLLRKAIEQYPGILLFQSTIRLLIKSLLRQTRVADL